MGARDTAANAQGRTDRLALEAGAGLILVPGTLLTLAAGSPFAGMLLVLAVLIRRFGRTPRAAAASPVAALLTLAGLLVAIVPLARLGLLVTSIVQLMRVFGTPDARLECWLFPLAAAAAGAFLIGARTDPATLRPRTIASITLLVLTLATVTTAEIAAFTGADMTDDATVTAVRASVLVLALGVVHVLAAWRLRAPVTLAVGWIAAGLAGFALVSAVGTQATEPFELVTVPLGLAIVVGQVLAGRARPADTEEPVAVAIVTGAPVSDVPVAVRARWIAAGLALALLPGAVVGGTNDLLRPVLALTIGGAFAVSGALLLVRPRWASLAWPALGVGALTVVLTASSRIQPLLELAPNGPDTRLEAWLLPSALILAAVGTGLVTVTRRTDEGTAPGRGEATDAPALHLGYVLLVLAIIGVFAAEVVALGYEPLAVIRVILLVWTFSALHLAAFWYDDSRPGRMVAWVAIGAGGGAVVAGSAYAAPATVEIVSIPLAIALLATG
ncbi:hypothetical protein [Cryobacterium sp. TMT2-42-4]|uniref:hypothetical protein n=1 Tax=Cryobacterium sp. TMT2-42-4 TaxID=1259255 RepID=UPI00106C3FED|nr:hypothetical protein [Cryobacterium sp. TMT2-42-4]TFC37136.1 hypothetical protein E3O18_06000 [Cryobacterium sp. TMT2-42-4]